MRHITRHGMCALIALAAAAVILPAAAGPALARDTVYVDINVVGGNGDGTSWTHAYTYLQDGLSNSANNDVIKVAGGVYYPDEDENGRSGDDTVSFVLKNGQTLEGGYHGYCPILCGGENVRDETSTLSGDIDGDDELDADNSQHVVRATGLASATVLDGFTVGLGYADGTATFTDKAGAMLVHNCSNFTIANCTFENNYAKTMAGAIYVVLTANGPGSSQTTIENCEFNDNEAENSGGAIFFYKVDEDTGHNLTVTDTDFNRNNSLVEAGGAQGGALKIRGAERVEITDCDFNDNFAFLYGGALELRVDANSVEIDGSFATITNCTFTGNGNKFTDGPDLFTKTGGAVRIDNARKTEFINCTFTGNKCGTGAGGAIWAEAPQGTGSARDVEFNLTDCTFLRNEMTNQAASSGGGALWVKGNKAPPGPELDGVIHGTWTRCTFIENQAVRGGAIYIHNSARFDIEDCLFIANDGGKAGGGIGIGDPEGIGTTKVYICESQFISNTSARGGAVHNHEGAVTYMVNCIVAGNSSTKEGGGVFNSQHTGSNPAEIYMHNCLIAGNVADGPDSDDMGGGVFNGLNITGFLDDPGVMELIQCTLLGNHAGYKYGGAIDASKNSTLRFYNSISRGNTSVSESDTFKNQLFHIEVAGVGYAAGDVSNFVADGTLPTAVYDDNPTWTGDDPDFLDGGTSATWTGSASYDPDTGQTTFTFSTCPSVDPGGLFRPDASNPLMLLVESHIDDPPGPCYVVCWGFWSGSGTTGTGFDLHIDDTGSAYDFGHTSYVPFDWCELDGITTPPNDLPWDLDENTREVNDPDCGVYEIQP